MNPDGGSDTKNSKEKIGNNIILESDAARTSNSDSNESRQRLMESVEATFVDGREEKHANSSGIDVPEQKEEMYYRLATLDDGNVGTNSVTNQNTNAAVQVLDSNNQIRKFESDPEKDMSEVNVLARDRQVSWSKSPSQRNSNSASNITDESNYFKPIKVNTSCTRNTHLTSKIPQGFLPSRPFVRKVWL